MVGELLTPAAWRSINEGERAGSFAAVPSFEVRRFGEEVAGELGVDLSRAAHGLTPETIRQYEIRTHSPRSRRRR